MCQTKQRKENNEHVVPKDQKFRTTLVSSQPELESCMMKLPLLAFAFTIDDKTFGFQLFHVSTFFQLSAFYTQNTSAFSSWFTASFPALAFFFHQKLRKIGKKPKAEEK